ncbi:MAG: MoaD/ThiS family protein [Planctomycetota bacterium]|jgi:molybdopterin converting factor small subunit
MPDATATVTVELPSLLSPLVGGQARLTVEAVTLRGALDAAVARHPSLAVHLFDETGGLREHVLCLHNGANSRWRGSLDVPVATGDVVTVLQAVSGG